MSYKTKKYRMINFNLRKLFLTALGLFIIGNIFSQNVLTLDEALKIAEENSPEIVQSRLSLERSQENLKAQRAQLKSKFSFIVNPFSYSNSRTYNDNFSQWNNVETYSSSGILRVEQPILYTGGTLQLDNSLKYRDSKSDINFGSGTEKKPYSGDLNLTYNQPLFTYNKLKLDLKKIELSHENTDISYQLKRLNIEKSVTQMFFSLYMSQMSVDINKDELKNTEESFAITKNKVEADLMAVEELYQAELNLASARSSLQNAEVSLENSKDDFKKFLGISIYEDITVMADVSVNVVKVELNKATDLGLDNRMELRQREIDIENAQFDLLTSSATNEFKGDLQLSLGVTGNGKNIQDIAKNPGNTPSVGVSFNIPIWDWGVRKARINAAKKSLQSSKINLEQEKLQIILDIRKVYRKLQNLWTQIEIAKQSEKNAQLTYDINLERYKNGDLTSMDLKQFQKQLSDKKKQSAQAVMDYKLELLNLKIQTLFDFETQESIVPQQYKK